jgi:hypothetical protein
MNISDILNQLSITNEINSILDTNLTILFIQVLFAVALGYSVVKTLSISDIKVGEHNFFHRGIIIFPLIIMGIIYFVGSSIAMSIGLIGSLSIVRFRTAIKDPFELLILLWCILIGIGIGSKQVLATTLISLSISLLVFILGRSKKNHQPEYKLIVESSREVFNELVSYFNIHDISFDLITYNVKGSSFFYYVELRIDEIYGISGELKAELDLIEVNLIKKV